MFPQNRCKEKMAIQTRAYDGTDAYDAPLYPSRSPSPLLDPYSSLPGDSVSPPLPQEDEEKDGRGPIYEEITVVRRGCCNESGAVLKKILANCPAVVALASGAGIDLSTRQIARLFPDSKYSITPFICLISSATSITGLVLSILSVADKKVAQWQTKFKTLIEGFGSILPALIEQEILVECKNSGPVCTMDDADFFKKLGPAPLVITSLFIAWKNIPIKKIEEWSQKSRALKIGEIVTAIIFTALLYSRNVQLLVQNIALLIPNAKDSMKVTHPAVFETIYISTGLLATYAQARKCAKEVSIFMDHVYAVAVAVAAGVNLYSEITDPKEDSHFSWLISQTAVFSLTFFIGLGATFRLSGRNEERRERVKDYAPPSLTRILRNEGQEGEMVDEQKLAEMLPSTQAHTISQKANKRCPRCTIL
jgi:hypothetical protein